MRRTGTRLIYEKCLAASSNIKDLLNEETGGIIKIILEEKYVQMRNRIQYSFLGQTAAVYI